MLNAKKYQLGLFIVLSESFSYLAFQNMLQIDLSRFVTTFTELRQRITDRPNFARSAGSYRNFNTLPLVFQLMIHMHAIG